MIKAKIIPAIALFSVMLASCYLLPDFTMQILEEGSFYAQDMKTKDFYKVRAEMMCEGRKCVVWAEKGSGITRVQAQTIADEYDNKIRALIVDAFSEKNITYTYKDQKYYFNDILDFANWLTGRDDKKLTILMLNIRDGYKNPREDTYVAGYFYAGNFLSEGKIPNTSSYSNGRDMIYIDTDPGWKDRREQTFVTFAHELQHLVNYVTSVLLDDDPADKKFKYTDVWIDEGLSAYAEYLYLGENPNDKCEWLIDSRNGIENGNNFFVWGNHKDDQFAILDDYATVYLFFRWLYLQANAGLQPRIFRDITNSTYSDYQAVTEVASKINSSWSDWETLLRTWLAANYYPDNAVYGYKGDLYLQEGHGGKNSSFKGIRVNHITGNEIALYPGEGVYSIIDGQYPNVNVGNIRYQKLIGNGRDVLLTFNANTNNSEASETGSLTGVSSALFVSRTAAENAQTTNITGPFVIDAQDLLGRGGDKPNRLPR